MTKRERDQQRTGDPLYGPTCACGGPKAKQARRCMGCRSAARKSRAEAWADWYAANRERCADAQRARLRDPAVGVVSLARLREWKRANPAQVSATNRRAKQRRRGMAAADSEYAETLRRDPCSYCGAPSAHADHIEAIARGGDAGWPNLTAACARCNHAKGVRQLLAFLLNEKEAA